MKIIYDFGAHMGQNTEYYLQRASRVVAVEANPTLCRKIESKFPEAIDKSLFVENVALSNTSSQDINFYVHRSNTVLSSLVVPKEEEDLFEKIIVRSELASSIIKKYGEPYYVKIDLEHYDRMVIDDMFKNSIFPKYLSAEIHTEDVLDAIFSAGCYDRFKIVDGSTVSEKYNNVNGVSFEHHSAGPFGEEVAGPWKTYAQIKEQLFLEGFGWKDVHAKRTK